MKQAREKKNSLLLLSITILIGLILVCFIVFLVFFISRFPLARQAGDAEFNQQIQSVLEEDADDSYIEIADTDPEVGGIVEKVSKHILLPKGEYVVATVNDLEKLKEQIPGVFDYAKKGDKLLFYPNGMIIYDPVVDRIADVIRLGAPIEKVFGAYES